MKKFIYLFIAFAFSFSNVSAQEYLSHSIPAPPNCPVDVADVDVTLVGSTTFDWQLETPISGGNWVVADFGTVGVATATFTINNVAVGSYRIRFFDLGSGVPASTDGLAPNETDLSAEFDVLPTVSSMFGNLQFANMKCNESDDGTATAAFIAGGNGSFTYTWNASLGGVIPPGQTNNVALSGLQEGTYSCVIISNPACPSYTPTPIEIVNPPVIEIDTTIVNVDCNGNATGSIDITVTGGETPYTYNWVASAGGNLAPGGNLATDDDLSDLPAGTYTCQVEDAFGCEPDPIVVIITEPADPLGGTTVPTPVACNPDATGEIELTPTGGNGGYTYTWVATAGGPVPPAQVTDKDLTDLPAGTYEVTITDSEGCVFTTSEDITQPALPLTATSVIVDIACNAANQSLLPGVFVGSIDLTPDGGTPGPGYIYSWVATAPADLGANAPGGQDLTDLIAGEYICTITDDEGCEHSHVAEVVERDPIDLTTIAIVSNNMSCFGIADGDAEVNPSGGLPYDDTNPASVPNLGEPYVYEWFFDGTGLSEGQTTKQATGLSADIYFCRVTDSLECFEDSDPITIANPAEIVIAWDTVVDISCNGLTDGMITIDPDGGTPPYTYTWTEAIAGALAFTDSTSIDNTTGLSSLFAGDFTISVTDTEGCPPDDITLTVVDPPLLSGTADFSSNTNCWNDSSGVALATVPDIATPTEIGTPPYTYLWTNGQTVQTADSLWAGTHSCVITDSRGCTHTTNDVTITNQPVIDISIVNLPATCHSSVTETAAGAYVADGSLEVTPSVAPPTPGATYDIEWFDASMVSLQVNNGVAVSTLSALETGTYFCSITDGNGCDTLHQIFLPEPGNPVTFGPTTVDSVTCFGIDDGAIDITPAGGTIGLGYTFLWTASAGGDLVPGGNLATDDDLSGLPAGTYDLTLTDGNTCLTDTTINVPQPTDTLEVAGLGSVVPTPPLCHPNNADPVGSNLGSVQLNPTGGTAPYTYSWRDNAGIALSPIQNTNTGNGFLAGVTYQCMIEDLKGCQFLWEDQISGPTEIAVTMSAVDSVSCFGASDGVAGVDAVLGGTPSLTPPFYTYNWSTGDNTQNISALAPTRYYVEVFDVNFCKAIDSVDVLEPSEVTATLVTTDVSCNGESTGQIEATLITASWPGVTFPPNPTPGNAGLEWESLTDPTFAQHFDDPIYQNLPAGTYQLTLRDGHGCENILSEVVIENPPIQIFPTVTSPTVTGANDGSISVLVTGGVPVVINPLGTFPPNTYGSLTWIGPGGYTNGPSAFADNITNLEPGTYNVNVIDAEFCEHDMNIVVNDPACTIAIDLDTIQPLCFEDSGSISWINIDGLAPYTNLLTGPTVNDTIVNYLDFTTSPSAYPVAAGVYDLTVVDATGTCVAVANIIIDDPNALVATITTTEVVCNGDYDGTAIISLAGGVPFSGANPYSIDYGIVDPTLTNLTLPAGNYNAVVADSNNCDVYYNGVVYPLGLVSYTIVQPTAVVVSTPVITLVPCGAVVGGTAQVTASFGTPKIVAPGVEPYDYSWSNAPGNPTALDPLLTNLAVGTFICTVTDANGCEVDSDPAIITPAIQVDALAVGTDPSCSAGTGSNDGQILVSLISGSDIKSIVLEDITIPASPVAAGSISFPAGNTHTFTGLTPGIYQVSILDIYDCEDIEVVTLTPPAPITFTLTPTNPSSGGASDGQILTTALSGGTPDPITGYDFAWELGGGLVGVTQDLTNLSGNGVFTLTVTDANGCTGQAVSFINNPACNVSITEILSVQPPCFGQNGQWQWTNAGGLAPYSQTITTSTGVAVAPFTGAAGSALLPGNPTGGTINYTLTVTDAGLCTAQLFATMDNPSPIEVVYTNPVASPSAIDVDCNGVASGQASIIPNGGTPPYNYVWSNGDLTQTVTGLTAGTYSVDVTDDEGCPPVTGLTTIIVVDEPAALSVSIDSTSESCFGFADGTATANVLGGTPDPAQASGYTYFWSNTQTTQTATGLEAGVAYSVLVTDLNGCTFLKSNIFIPVVNTTLTATVEPLDITDVNCFGDANGSLEVTTNGGTTPLNYLWNDGDAQQTKTATNLLAGAYICTVTDANGCNTTVTATVGTPSDIVLTPSTTDASCSGATDGSATLLGGVSGGTPNLGGSYNYSWAGGVATTINYTGLSAGSYNVTVSDANGCTQSTSVSIGEPDPLVLTVSEIAEASCFGDADGQAQAVITGGTSPYSFSWISNLTGLPLNPAQITAISTDTSNANLLTAGTYSVTVSDVASGIGGCPTAIEPNVVINEPALLEANLTVDSVTCFGGNDGKALVSPTGGRPFAGLNPDGIVNPYTYSWTGTGSIVDSSLGLSFATYFVTITDSLNCAPTSFTVNIPQPAAALGGTVTTSNYNGYGVSCFGEDDGFAILNPIGGTSPYTYVLINNTSTVIAPPDLAQYNGLSAALSFYSFKLEDINGCDATISFDLTENDQIFANMDIMDASCFANGSATVNPVGGNNFFYDVTWFDPTIVGNTAPSISPGANYTVSIEDADGCTMDTTFDIQTWDALVLTLSSDSTLCPSGVDGVLIAAATDGNPFTVGPAYLYEWFDASGVSIATTPSVVGTSTPGGTPVASGVYSCTITDADGCTETATVNVFSPDPILANDSIVPVSCFGGDDGKAFVSAVGGTAPYSITFFANGNQTHNGIALGVYDSIVDVAAGNYAVSITDAEGCLNTMTINVTEPGEIVVTCTPQGPQVAYGYDIRCAGGNDANILVTATGGNGIYQYSRDDINYAISNEFGVNAGIGGSPTEITASIIDSITNPFVHDTLNFFTAFVRDANGCEGSTQYFVRQPDSIDPGINVTNPLTCSSGSDGQLASNATGGVPHPITGYNYTWSTGTTGVFLSGLPMDTYSVVVQDALGCTGTESFVLEPIYTVTLSVSTSPVTCVGADDGTATANASGGLGNYLYSWTTNPVQTTQTATGLEPSPYIVTVTDFNGCIGIDSVEIIESPTILKVDSANVTDISCYGLIDGSAIVYASGGNAAFGGIYTYEWFNLSTGVSIAATQNADNLGPDSYYCTITDLNGCTVHDTIQVNEPAELIFGSFGSNDVLCFGANNGEAIVNPSGGITPYAYDWLDDTGNSLGTGNTVSSLSPGTYSCIIADDNLCDDTLSFTIVEPAALSFTSTVDDPLCTNDNNGSITINVAGGTQPFFAFYSGGDTISSLTNTIVITDLSADNATLTVFDGNNCVDSAVNIALIDPLELVIKSISITDLGCFDWSDGSVTSMVEGGSSPYSYNLEDNTGVVISSSNATIEDLIGGEYIYHVIDSNGCTVDSSITIGIPAEIDIQRYSSCYGTLVVDVLNTSGSYDIIWRDANDSTNTVISDDTVVSYTSAGKYQVTVIDDIGCSKVDSFIIPELIDYTTAAATCSYISDGIIDIYDINDNNPPYSVYVNDVLFSENVINAVEISELSSANQTVRFVYNLDGSSCSWTYTIKVGNSGGPDCVNPVPVISPNNDGLNDTWRPARDVDTGIEVTIFNRWGQVEYFYSGNSQAFEWDGLSTDGEELPSSDYYFVIRYKNAYNTNPDITGVVTLIR